MNEDKIDFAKRNFEASREDKLRILELYYLKFLVEDPIDGTGFDCDILDAIKELKKRYVTATP